MPDTDEVLSPAEEAKLDAEARKIEAEILAAEAAEERAQEKHQFELRKAELELKQLEATVVKEEAYASEMQIRLNKLVDEEADRKASNRYHQVYNFSEAVNAASVQAAVDRLSAWSRQRPGCEIEVLFTSPGGSVLEGLKLYDFLIQLRSRGHKVVVTALGYAASMAAVLLQAGDVRRCGAESWLLLHEVSAGTFGKVSEMEDQLDFVNRLQERILNIFASRSKASKVQLKKRWKFKDWWISSDEALELGLIDEILK